MLVDFLRRLVVEALDGGFFNRAIQALNLVVRPRVGGLGEPVLHAAFPADAVEVVPTRQQLMRLRGELHAVVRQNGSNRESNPARQGTFLFWVRHIFETQNAP